MYAYTWLPIVKECEGCNHTTSTVVGRFCNAYRTPYRKWSMGRCPLATHVGPKRVDDSEKMLNPIKASKRKSKQRG